jgi:hypothetical protein
LVTSFWISGAAAPSGLKLGLQHSAASMAAGAPLAIAVVAPGAQHLVLWGLVVCRWRCLCPCRSPGGRAPS